MLVEGNKGEKKWDNRNSMINEIYLKKDLMHKEKLLHLDRGSCGTWGEKLLQR